MFLKLVPDHTEIPFTSWRMIAFVISTIVLIASVGLLLTRGLNLGVDFRGGATIEVTDDEPLNEGRIREAVSGLGLGDISVQGVKGPAGEIESVILKIEQQTASVEELAIATPEQSGLSQGLTVEGAVVAGNVDSNANETAQAVASQKVKDVIAELLGDGHKILREDVVGPTVSGELIRAGITAVILAIGMMLVYIWFRFEWQFSVGAILALAHDVTLTLGIFALTRIEFNLPIIAALLTIVGYSMNDTVVVYDRVRENLRKYKKKDLAEVLDLSINDTLSRTMMTSVTTLLALLALYFLGGEVLRGFTFAMILGVLVGTYSSIFVASPLLLLLGVKREWGKNDVVTTAPIGS